MYRSGSQNTILVWRYKHLSHLPMGGNWSRSCKWNHLRKEYRVRRDERPRIEHWEASIFDGWIHIPAHDTGSINVYWTTHTEKVLMHLLLPEPKEIQTRIFKHVTVDSDLKHPPFTWPQSSLPHRDLKDCCQVALSSFKLDLFLSCFLLQSNIQPT